MTLELKDIDTTLDQQNSEEYSKAGLSSIESSRGPQSIEQYEVAASFDGDFSAAIDSSILQTKGLDPSLRERYPNLALALDRRSYPRQGDRGAVVRELQELLQAARVDPGGIDGIYGSKTHQAVLALQRSSNELQADGIPGPKTVQEAFRRATDHSRSDERDSDKENDSGISPEGNELDLSPELVRDVQARLNGALGCSLSVDGQMGSKTRFALAIFQLSQGIHPDGKVNEETRQSLHRLNGGRTNVEDPFDYTQLPRVEAQRGFMHGRPHAFTGRRIGDYVMQEKTAAQFLKLMQLGLKEGVFLQVNSAFRTNEEQAALFRAWQRRESPFIAAAPGRSNHQSGIAIDIEVGGFRGDVYKWMVENAGQFGFKRTVVGKNGEAHHWEYRGPGSVKVDAEFRGGVK